MERIRKTRSFSGTTQIKPRDYEIQHRALACKAAIEGMVLLKNENQVLPLTRGSKIALYGAGATQTIKGGTGSGDVNARELVTIYEGMKHAGFEITTDKWLASYEKEYAQARENWRGKIWEKADADPEGSGFGFFTAYSTTPFLIPAGDIPEKTDTDTAIYVLSRNAGEGADRYDQPGDYQLTDREEQILGRISELYQRVIVILNIGGLIDLSFLERYQNIEGLLYAQQPGMEAGNAVAAILTGEASPSGKLTDTLAFHYADYPSAATFSHNNGDISQDIYEEGIYVGYRYFDSFEKPVRYSFGYGLSYTDFSWQVIGIEHFDLGSANPQAEVHVQVMNTGNRVGREVIQVYAACPQGRLQKEFRRLIGFQKTALLKAGEKQELTIRFPLSFLASYDEKMPGWIMEKGCYGIFVGNSLAGSSAEAAIWVQDELHMTKTHHICTPTQEIAEIQPDQSRLIERDKKMEEALSGKPSFALHAGDVIMQEICYTEGYDEVSDEVRKFVDTLSTEQLIRLSSGLVNGDQVSNLGSAGKSVPGSAAQTSDCALEQNLASIVLADGPAGLRLINQYQVEDEEMIPVPFEMSMEGGFLCREKPEKKGETYYQYCTAFPVGTLLAQTWNTALIQEIGQAVAQEMELFGVTLWLAPGMNIHRNPLCGRNFEYYAEDPVLAGRIAAAMTQGVQSQKGCGTTIKHFACNNAEDNRMGSNSILSERTLREIYLRGFEIAVKESRPMAIMTSYNLINGIHAANHHDLCTAVARNEWGFGGMIMTDWMTTYQTPSCTASGCMRAGNDTVMPGFKQDHDNIREELAAGTLSMEDLKRSICHLVDTIWKSNQYK